ncbi:hypothetical protein CTAYLR_008172 [Chrysophaeum taylorii]|uniref:magnesium chelatase n=1 Tax=Chrysophaeum taylorii TaxID=2483200 RepID=A0AAD7XJL1_9STRA|nr:hypothetical protein CTAYLR_008172 [Chrysophaeum taylorii]
MRPTDAVIAAVVGALCGVYVVRHAQAWRAEENEKLRSAIARRDEVAKALAEAKASIEEERRRQRAEFSNLTRAVPRRGGAWQDFPCALRELRVARVTRTCEVSCRDDARCDRAVALCRRLIECEAALVRVEGAEISVAEARTNLARSSARLVRDVEAAKANDGSLAALAASEWWAGPALTEERKPRTYVVVSYGGCGSKMLAGWLSSLGKTKKLVSRVYHLHDATPPDLLRELPPPRAPPSQQRDFRARRFPGGGRFRTDTPVVGNLDDYRVLFIFKDPVEALVSRYGFGHCEHLGGDCGETEASFPKLDAYAAAGRDRMGLVKFFDAYVEPNPRRQYPVLLLNYHKLWDNLPALMRALGLPVDLAGSFPERTETVRNDLTGAAENNEAHTEATRRALDKIYEPILDRIRTLPATPFVRPHKAAAAAPEHASSSAAEVVLISGFESFNIALYEKCAAEVGKARPVRVSVFSERDVSSRRADVDAALEKADAFIGSLVFDYDDVEWLRPRLEKIRGPRLVFECATELMSLNRVGRFEMGGGSGAPAAVKAVLSKFGSGREEDKLQGYLKLLKIGPELLKLVPGDNKLSDLRTWLELYRYWNEGGEKNVASMFQVLYDRLLLTEPRSCEAPPLVEFPAVGVSHPAAPDRVFDSPAAYLRWRENHHLDLAPVDAPRVAVLLYRKHVLTRQPYVPQLVEQLEKCGLCVVPIFITGVEAHTVVRDLLTSDAEISKIRAGTISRRPRTYDERGAVKVDAIVNAIGFPLVGGPAGSMSAGRDVAVAEELLTSMDLPYVVAAPLLLQEIRQWRASGVSGLQSVVLYGLPELDGAIDPVVLGGLAGDTVALVPERVRRLASRIKQRIALGRRPLEKKRVAIVLYGYPPNVGSVGTAALLNVPKSLDVLLSHLAPELRLLLDDDQQQQQRRRRQQHSFGEAVIAALSLLSTQPLVTNYKFADVEVVAAARRAKAGDARVAAALARLVDDDDDDGGGGGNLVPGVEIVSVGIDREEELGLSKYMRRDLDECWPPGVPAPGLSATGDLVINGLLLAGRVFVGVQPLLGYEGDPTRLLFEKRGNRLTPHAQYVAFYEMLKRDYDACVHLGTHGTVEWLPGQPLGNDAKSWPDELLGGLPNFYVYAANNPSESILAKRRGYATIVSHATPPYDRSGLYLDLANLKDLLDELFEREDDDDDDSSSKSILEPKIREIAESAGLSADVPERGLESFRDYAFRLSTYLLEVRNRLFSSGLRVFGTRPDVDEVRAYLEAFFQKDDAASSYYDREIVEDALRDYDDHPPKSSSSSSKASSFRWWSPQAQAQAQPKKLDEVEWQAREIAARLGRATDEIDNLLRGLNGGYVPPGAGGDLLRDGVGALPTGRNIHALDPYRMPSESAWKRGQAIADRLISQHREANDGAFPETIAVALWGLDAIKTRGESVAIAIALAGGVPVREGTGRIVRFDPVPLADLGRPRIDVLATLSGIFRDSFENVVLLLDDFFERCASLDEEPEAQNYIRKHVALIKIKNSDEQKPAARLFSNPPGDYGSLVNDQVNSGAWEDKTQLGDTWASRNAFAYGRDLAGATSAASRANVLDALLETTDRVVQEIDSVEYGLTDINEYYANTGALKVAAEARREDNNPVAVSVVEAFDSKKNPEPRDLERVLRIEYRSKLLNPKWAESMVNQGAGGAYEISTRMTAAVGWAATAKVDDFVFDGAAERYALDEQMATRLRKLNPEAYKNVLGRLLEAAGRGMWNADNEVLDKLRDLYADTDDAIEGVS